MSNNPGLHIIGEANFSDHGANRLGASALMQGLADGYFVLPYTLPNYLAGQIGKRPSTDHAEFKRVESEVRERVRKLLEVNGDRTLTLFHRELGLLLWDKCGMTRNAAGLREALGKIPELRDEFWKKEIQLNKLTCCVITDEKANPARSEEAPHETLMVIQQDSSSPLRFAQNDDRR